MRIENKISELGYTLPEVSSAGLYKPVRRVGNVLYVSGQIPWVNGEVKYWGRAGKERDIEYAQDAARLCVLNMLAAVKSEVGDLDKIKQIVKITVMVNSDADFDKQHIVANGASQLLIDIFGEEGRAARSAIGVSSFRLMLRLR
ncbi:RidA family protein [Thermoclostridium stercorarium]|uniref:RidA family protein n=1 Tax=Thermoclostridium stercorarium TaxID=1510 RepID=UPI000B09EC5D|nr:RidA family protein [Thermoclostridium stercorarium]